MATYKFYTLGGGDWTIQRDSENIIAGSSNAEASAAVRGSRVYVVTFYPYFEAEISLSTNTIEIGGVDVTANGAATIVEQLNETIFTGAAGGGDGVSGLALESYDNTAMSAPVQAYVFRDADDNIFRVYEPLRNNDVSRSVFAYADTIDKFPFDSELWDDVTAADLKIQNPENIRMSGMTFGAKCEIKNPGTNTSFLNGTVGAKCILDFNGSTDFSWVDSTMEDSANFWIDTGINNCSFYDLQMGNASYLEFYAPVAVTSSQIDANCTISANHQIGIGCHFLTGCTYTTTVAITRKVFVRLGATTYELGEAAGAATLTAV